MSAAEDWGDTPGVAWGDLAEAQAELEVARAAHAAATDARAAEVWRARRAGATLAEVGAALGMARPSVLELERRGEAVALAEAAAGPVRRRRRDTPEAASGPGAIPPGRIGVDLVDLAAMIGQRRCLREGCPFPAEPERRFCAGHLYN